MASARATVRSSGGAYELDSMMALMTIHQCKSLNELPGAVARFERDVDTYEKRTLRAFPPEFKVPAFLRMVPKSHASDMRWRFSQGATDYDALKSSTSPTPRAPTPRATTGATGLLWPSLARSAPSTRASRQA